MGDVVNENVGTNGDRTAGGSRMLLSLDDDVLRDGFCWGQYEPKLDDEGRLRLPKEVVDILKEHGVTGLYRCPDPTDSRFVLCPPENWKTFVQAVRKHFAESLDAEKAFRLLCCGTPANIDIECRIRITKACLDHAKLGPGKRVKMLGVGKWYEVSAL